MVATLYVIVVRQTMHETAKAYDHELATDRVSTDHGDSVSDGVDLRPVIDPRAIEEGDSICGTVAYGSETHTFTGLVDFIKCHPAGFYSGMEYWVRVRDDFPEFGKATESLLKFRVSDGLVTLLEGKTKIRTNNDGWESEIHPVGVRFGNPRDYGAERGRDFEGNGIGSDGEASTEPRSGTEAESDGGEELVTDGGREENADTESVELSDEAASATKTALNRVDSDLSGRLSVGTGKTDLRHECVCEALSAVRAYRGVLERSEGEPTIFDPNGEDTYLSWARTAEAELRQALDAAPDGPDRDDPDDSAGNEGNEEREIETKLAADGGTDTDDSTEADSGTDGPNRDDHSDETDSQDRDDRPLRRASDAFDGLREGDIIEVAQYEGALRVSSIARDVGMVGIEFVNESKRANGATKHLIQNEHSGDIALVSGRSDKGKVSMITVLERSQDGHESQDDDGEDDDGGDDDRDDGERESVLPEADGLEIPAEWEVEDDERVATATCDDWHTGSRKTVLFVQHPETEEWHVREQKTPVKCEVGTFADRSDAVRAFEQVVWNLNEQSDVLGTISAASPVEVREQARERLNRLCDERDAILNGSGDRLSDADDRDDDRDDGQNDTGGFVFDHSDETKGDNETDEPETESDEDDDSEDDADEQERMTVTDDWEGVFLYSSWGYNQTNVEFAQIVDVSDTGKTVLCRMVRGQCVEQSNGSDSLRPSAEQYGDEFRLHVRGPDGVPMFRGSYPHIDGDMDTGKRRGWLIPWSNEVDKTVHRTSHGYRH
jgi:hypothetical protein